MSAQAEQPRAAVLRRAEVCKPLRSSKNDWRHTRQRFRIINDRRPAPEPYDGREGRTDARYTALAFERFHQRRLLSNFIGSGAAMPVHVEVVSASEDIFAEKAFRVRVGNCLLHDFEQVAILAANVDVTSMRADSDAGNHHAFNH